MIHFLYKHFRFMGCLRRFMGNFIPLVDYYLNLSQIYYQYLRIIFSSLKRLGNDSCSQM